MKLEEVLPKLRLLKKIKLKGWPDGKFLLVEGGYLTLKIGGVSVSRYVEVSIGGLTSEDWEVVEENKAINELQAMDKMLEGESVGPVNPGACFYKDCTCWYDHGNGKFAIRHFTRYGPYDLDYLTCKEFLRLSGGRLWKVLS